VGAFHCVCDLRCRSRRLGSGPDEVEAPADALAEGASDRSLTTQARGGQLRIEADALAPASLVRAADCSVRAAAAFVATLAVVSTSRRPRVVAARGAVVTGGVVAVARVVAARLANR
jgi:hypothetical protein